MRSASRWIYVAVGCVVLLFSGLVYAWSVLSGPIAAEFPHWSTAQLSLTFTIVMSFFCLGGLTCGALSARISPRIFLWISALLFLAGFLLTASMRSLPMLYVGFGVVCGLASGFSYNAVLGTVGAWFPDKQGLVSGILLMGFGLSSFLIGKLYQRFTPPPAAKKKRYANPVAEELGTAAMLRRPAFWLYYLWAVLLSAAGLALVSQSTSIAREIGRTVSPGGITTAVGMISLANAAGRVVLGGLFDRLGRSRTMQLVGGIFLLTGLVLIGALKLGSFPLLIVGFLLGGMAYGGVTPANAAFVSSYYGMRHYAVNLSVVVTNLLFASFGSTIAGALYDATGSYLSTDAMILVLAVLSAAVSFGIDLCDRRMLKQR